MTLDWQSGAAARITVTPTSGAPTVHGLQLRANPWSTIGETVIQSTIAPDYTRDDKTLTIAAWPQIAPAHAKAIADSYLARYQDPHPIVKITVGNDTPLQMQAILSARLSDRVRPRQCPSRDRPGLLDREHPSRHRRWRPPRDRVLVGEPGRRHRDQRRALGPRALGIWAGDLNFATTVLLATTRPRPDAAQRSAARPRSGLPESRTSPPAVRASPPPPSAAEPTFALQTTRST